MPIHEFEINIGWHNPDPTLTPRVSRKHHISAAGIPEILGSAAPAYHGDKDAWNPEQLLLAATAQCHMMTYLYLALRAGINVRSYSDSPHATLTVHPDGAGQITCITLTPKVQIAAAGDWQSVYEEAVSLHEQVPEYCFIQRSLATPVVCNPTVELRSN